MPSWPVEFVVAPCKQSAMSVVGDKKVYVDQGHESAQHRKDVLWQPNSRVRDKCIEGSPGSFKIFIFHRCLQAGHPERILLAGSAGTGLENDRAFRIVKHRR
jgi:hypothetical protein